MEKHPAEISKPAGTDPPDGAVLVPLDGSSASASVLPVARLAAELFDAPIHLLHVAEAALSPAALLRRCHLQPDDLHGMVLDSATGTPAEVIARTAAERGSRLIVMSTHGWTADRRRPYGHVAREMLMHAPCSLLLVRLEVAERLAKESGSFKRILIPLDGSPTTAAALGPAAELASRSGAELDVLHVATLEPPCSTASGCLSVPQYLDHPGHEWPAWEREFAARFLAPFAQQPLTVCVATGDPGEQILRTAQERGSDLIVIAWKGKLDHDGARTVRTVLRDAPCPVLFLRTDQSLPAAAATSGIA